MDKETVQLILQSGADFLTKIAEAMKQPAAHVYEVFVRQQVTEGITAIVGMIFTSAIVGVIGYLTFNVVRKLEKELENTSNSGTWYTVWLIIMLIVFVIVASSSGFLSISMSKIINPEYYAIKQIVETIKQ